MALIRREKTRKFPRINTHRRRTLKNLYIIILLTFGFSQDYSLQFDGDNDYVLVAEGENVFNINNSLTMSAWININEWKWMVVFDGSNSASNAPERNYN